MNVEILALQKREGPSYHVTSFFQNILGSRLYGMVASPRANCNLKGSDVLVAWIQSTPGWRLLFLHLVEAMFIQLNSKNWT